jgi:hypothetical protein
MIGLENELFMVLPEERQLGYRIFLLDRSWWILVSVGSKCWDWTVL